MPEASLLDVFEAYPETREADPHVRRGAHARAVPLQRGRARADRGVAEPHRNHGGRATLIRQERDGDTVVASAAGAWVVDQADALDRQLAGLQAGGARALRFELEGPESLDTAGAWLFVVAWNRLEEGGLHLQLGSVPPDRQALLDEIRGCMQVLAEKEAGEPPSSGAAILAWIAWLGEGVAAAAREWRDFVAFIGLLIGCSCRLALGRTRFEPASLFHHMQQTWINALPIVGLLAFLIGVVTLYQGSTQLERFGAQRFAVDLLGLSMLREVGVLLPAVIVAGRSGSSFRAQIGTMKARQEVDAMLATGIDPIAVLIAPRVVALVITFPLLAFFGALAGITGGMLMAWLDLGIPPTAFLDRLRSAVGLSDLLIGLTKAPVFAALVALTRISHRQ